MTRVKQRTQVTTKVPSVSHEVYKVAFGVLVGASVIIGLVAFASLGVGLIKVLALLA